MTGDRRPLRVLVVDDEAPAREILGDLLAAEPEVELIGECADGESAVEVIRRERPDLVFLDIRMPELDGFGVLESLAPEELPLVIFVTAYDQYAIQAFEVHALDYLLKPFDDERFAAAIGRARETSKNRDLETVSRRLVGLLEERRGKMRDEPDGRLSRLTIRSSGRVHFVKTDDIDWIEAADYYARIHAEGRSHLLREPLASLAERLDPEKFVRVHRSAIVNLDRVAEIRPLFKGSYAVVLEDGTRLKLSRSRRIALEERLAGA